MTSAPKCEERRCKNPGKFVTPEGENLCGTHHNAYLRDQAEQADMRRAERLLRGRLTELSIPFREGGYYWTLWPDAPDDDQELISPYVEHKQFLRGYERAIRELR